MGAFAWGCEEGFVAEAFQVGGPCVLLEVRFGHPKGENTTGLATKAGSGCMEKGSGDLETVFWMELHSLTGKGRTWGAGTEPPSSRQKAEPALWRKPLLLRLLTMSLFNPIKSDLLYKVNNISNKRMERLRHREMA